jgi:transcriptional regulator with XRE-family HTH domain
MDPLYAALMADSFGDQLRALLEAARLNQGEFGRKVDNAESYISNVINGHRKPPDEKAVLEKWADVLGIFGRTRENFMFLAMLSHLPESFRPYLLQLQRGLERWEAKNLPPKEGDSTRPR